MKNDFDFIKEKIENSGVKAPEELSGSAIRALIDDKQPAPIPLKPKRRWAPIAVIAASLVIVASLGVVLGSHLMNKPEQPPKNIPGVPGITANMADSLGLKSFNSYDEIEDEVKKLREKHNSSSVKDYFRFNAIDEEISALPESSASDGAVNGSNGGASENTHSETYKQVDGVDEADIIKTDGKYIYCVDNSRGDAAVRIFSADSDQPRLIAELNARQPKSTADETELFIDAGSYSYFGCSDIYLMKDRLILLCDSGGKDGGTSVVRVYDVSDVKDIKLLDSYSQSGRYASSRMIGDVLYIVSSFSPFTDRLLPYCNGEKIAYDCVYEIPDPDAEGFLVVSAYNTVDFNAQTETKAILGAVDDIYCNENNLYIYTSSYENSGDNWLSLGSAKVKSRILKVSLTDGLRFTAFAEIDGSIDDQYALDEYNGNLRVATTSIRNGKDVNNLFVLDEELQIIGSVTGFAKDESIKAVRYMGDTAYVITYEQTDPLFVIDLSDPAAPAILGEAKITGFSTMLVPIGDDLVLGLGYHTENEDYTTLEVQEGFKLALFDVSDKSNPKVLDSKSFVDCNSEVQYNPKALVYNPDRDDFIIPLNYAHYGAIDYFAEDAEIDVDDVPVDQDVYYGGMLNFKVEDGKIKVIEHYRSDKTSEVERCVYVGDTVYMTYYDYGEDAGINMDAKKYQ